VTKIEKCCDLRKGWAVKLKMITVMKSINGKKVFQDKEGISNP